MQSVTEHVVTVSVVTYKSVVLEYMLVHLIVPVSCPIATSEV